MAATAAAVSPKGMNSTPGMRGSTRVRYFSRPVVASAPRVFPWKPPIVETMRLRPVATFANLRAASTASAAGVAEEGVLQPSRRDLGQFGGKVGGGLAEERLSAHAERVELIFDGGHDLGMAMPEGEGAVATQAVEIAAAFVVFDVAALAVDLDAETGEGEELGQVGVDVLAVLVDDLGEVGVGIRDLGTFIERTSPEFRSRRFQ